MKNEVELKKVSKQQDGKFHIDEMFATKLENLEVSYQVLLSHQEILPELQYIDVECSWKIIIDIVHNICVIDPEQSNLFIPEIDNLLKSAKDKIKFLSYAQHFEAEEILSRIGEEINRIKKYNKRKDIEEKSISDNSIFLNNIFLSIIKSGLNMSSVEIEIKAICEKAYMVNKTLIEIITAEIGRYKKIVGK